MERKNTLKRKADAAELPESYMRNENSEPLAPKRTKPAPPKHGRRLFLQADLHWHDQYGRRRNERVKLLVDSGCSGPILNKDLVQKRHMPWVERDQPITVLTADGAEMRDAGAKYTEETIMRIADHQEELTWEISCLEKGIDGYLPISWLEQHNPDIQWDTGKLVWRSEYCAKHCLPLNMKDVVKGFIRMIQESKEWISSYCSATWSTQNDCCQSTKCQNDAERTSDMNCQKEGVAPSESSASAAWHNEEGGDVAYDLPEQYRPWASMFSEEEIKKLPKHSTWDHEIKLVEGTTPPYGPIYPLNEKELAVLREYINKQMAEGKIRLSKSSAGSPILFTPKADGTLRLCVDYRGLNKITVKDRTPLPLMTELREQVAKAKVFTKLDLRHGYNLVRIAKGDEWKTAFRTKYGLFEYLVMPFGLCNAPASFQAMINDVLRELIDEGVIVYIDDILIYSETEEEHTVLVQKVLEKLKKANLCVAINKSRFHVKKVEYLGYIISDEGIELSPEKVKAVENWNPPNPNATSAIKWAQEFLGFANFYRRFIEGFSKIAKPITDLTKKEHVYQWDSNCQKAFDILKTKFTEAPILAHFLSDQPTVIETDASDYALGAVLSQIQTRGDQSLHPVAYHSRKFKPAEINYDIHDKEMLAIVAALKEWEHMLKSCQEEFTVYTDHKNLEYFATTKVLSRRQARWAEFLSEFWFKVVYRPGRLNQKADILSRRRDDTMGEEAEATPRSLLKPGQWVANSASVKAVQKPKRLTGQSVEARPAGQSVEAQPDSEQWVLLYSARMAAIKVYTLPGTFVEKLKAAAKSDPDWIATVKAVKEKSDEVAPGFEVKDGILLYENRFVIPNDTSLKLKVLAENHDSKVAGHFGQYKTLERLRQNFCWSRMDEDCKDYVRSCDVCQRDKTSRRKKYGLLQPLDIPHQPWRSISMDFIVGLPQSDGFTQIWVVVDRLTKMAHFVPLRTGAKSPAKDLAIAFAREVWRLHGLPADIVSDRGSVFISNFWKELMEHLGVELNLSTAFHPQTDGQTERVNQVLEGYIRHYTSFQQDDWADMLPLAEHAYNTAISESTGVSPFFANYGFSPETQWVRPVKTGDKDIVNPASKKLLQRWQNIWTYLQESIQSAQQRMKGYYDQRVRKQPVMKPGDLVMVNMKNMKTKRPSKKLDHKRLGPVRILEAVGNRAFRVELPHEAKNHPVFHVAELELYRQSNIEGRKQPPPPVQEIEGEANYVVESIGKSRMNRRRKCVEYLVFWEGYPPEEATWEPAENLIGTANEVLEEFHKRNPRQPKAES